MNLDGALCLRSLATGLDASGKPLDGALAEQHRRVQAGIAETRLTGKLSGKPAVVVNGRADANLPPNFTSRAYFARNKQVEPASKLYYYEVTNAQHLDSFNQFAGYNEKLIPLHRYYIQAMDLMYAHLRTGTALPPSQVVHTIPRGPGAPPISSAPASSDVITMSGGRLNIPN